MKNKGLLIGIIGGACAAVGAMVAGALLFVRKRRANTEMLFEDFDFEEDCAEADDAVYDESLDEEESTTEAEVEVLPTYRKILNIGVDHESKKKVKTSKIIEE